VEDHAYEWNFVRPTILELGHSLLDRGCQPVLLPISARAEPETVIRLIEAAGAAGVFPIQFTGARVFSELESRGIPVVVINTSDLQDEFSTVSVDDFRGAYEGTRHLLGLGHRSIAFVEYERPDFPAVVADRFIGFRKALEEQGVSFSPDQRITIPFMDEMRLEKDLSALFGHPRRPTAIFAHDDYLGLYILRVLARLSLSVPEDVSLIAPGDVLDYTLPLMPQITTMRIDTALIGKIAASIMMERLGRSGGGIQVIKVKEQLVKRATCRAVEED
jgi:LacI family transcriptional regulator